MYTRTDLTLDDRLEIFSRYWRFSEEYGTVSHLAEEFRTSRQFIYDVAARVKEALDWQPAGRQEVEQQQEEIAHLKHRGRELAADCDQLAGQLALERSKPQQERFRLLLELALCPISEDKIVHCLEAAFGRDGQVSAGWVNGQLQKADAAALSILQKTELRQALHEAALDELFRHQQPILCVIGPQTLLATVPQAAKNRKGETWQAVLAQYPNLEFVVSDQASGLRKGVNDCAQEIAYQYDVFHFRRAMLDEVLELLKEVKLIHTKPLISMIEGVRPGLLTFLTVLEKKLAEIEVNWRYVSGSRTAAFDAMARLATPSPGTPITKRATDLTGVLNQAGTLEPPDREFRGSAAASRGGA